MHGPHLVRVRLSIEGCHIRHVLLECPQASVVLILGLVLLVVYVCEDVERLLCILLGRARRATLETVLQVSKLESKGYYSPEQPRVSSYERCPHQSSGRLA